MKTSYAAFAVGALLAITSFSAQAEERWPRWYLGLTGGFTFMSDQDVSGGSSAHSISLDNGYSYGGSIGYLPTSSAPILNNMRLEFEITHHTAKVDKVNRTGSSVNGSGYYDSTAYMANAFYDWQMDGAWAPYVGAGAGIAQVNLSKSSGVGNVENSDSVFAYQFMAGIGYAPTSIPNTVWQLGYRYLATPDITLSTGTSNTDIEYSTHSVEAGVRLRF